MSILDTVIKGKLPTDDEIAADLYDICDRVHASCDSDCPVYERLGHALNAHRQFVDNQGCDAFKAGSVMLKFIREFDSGKFKPAHEFVDAQHMALIHPDTFDAPSKVALNRIKVGDYVKVCANNKERFWVQVTHIDGQNLTGVVNNDLVETKHHGLSCNDIVEFAKCNIYQV
jgi:hypothetical protein